MCIRDSREALNQYVQDQLNAPLYEYGDDYVEYDESAQIQNTDIGADLDPVSYTHLIATQNR